MTITHAVWLAIAGAVGTLARALVAEFAVRLCGVGFPWATLLVNLSGSFLFGVVATLGRERLLPVGFETVILVGLLGGFTTYSSFAHQGFELFAAGRHATAVAYIAATNALGLAAVWAGTEAAGRMRMP
jgi:CrcB protein